MEIGELCTIYGSWCRDQKRTCDKCVRPFYLVPAVAVRQVVLAFYGLIRCKEWFMKVSQDDIKRVPAIS